MTEGAEGEAPEIPDRGGRSQPFLVGLVASYALAVFCWLTMSPPWGLIPESLAPLLAGPATGVIAWIALASWIAAATFAFWRFGRSAWPILLGAPLALYTPLQVLLTAVFCGTGLGCP